MSFENGLWSAVAVKFLDTSRSLGATRRRGQARSPPGCRARPVGWAAQLQRAAAPRRRCCNRLATPTPTCWPPRRTLALPQVASTSQLQGRS
jgi:hypothetical protein